MQKQIIQKLFSHKIQPKQIFKPITLYSKPQQSILTKAFLTPNKNYHKQALFKTLPSYNFSSSDPVKQIEELKTLEKQFMEIYNQDLFMMNAQQGYPVIEQIIQKKTDIYQTEYYNGWVDDNLIKIQYLYHIHQSPDAEQLTNKILQKLEEEPSNENLLLQSKVCERVSLKIATFIGLQDGIDKLKLAIDYYTKIENNETSEQYANLNNILANLYENNQQYEEAFLTYEKVGNTYNALIKSAENEEKQSYYGKLQASCYKQFAKLCRNLQLYKESETLLTAAYNIWNTIEGEEQMQSIDFVIITNELGELGIESGNYESSFRFLSKAEKGIKFIDEQNAAVVCQVYNNLGKFHFLVQNYPKSYDYAVKAEELFDKYPVPFENKCQVLEQKVTVQYMQQKQQEALKTAEEGKQLCNENQQFGYFYLKFLYFEGLIYQSQNEFSRAQESGEQLLEKALELYGESSEHVADGHRIVGHAQISQSQDNIDSALDHIQKAANVYGLIGTKITDYMYCLEDLIRYGQAFNRFQKARDACVELKVIRQEIMGNAGMEEQKIEKELEIIDKKIAEIDIKIQMEKNKEQEQQK